MANKEFSYNIKMNTNGFDKASKSTLATVRDFTLAFNGLSAIVSKANAMIGNLVNTYKVQANAELAVTQALNNAGIAGEKYNQVLFKQAKEIQKLTTVGDEQVLQLQAYSLNLGVSADKTDEMTKSAIGLNKAFGISYQESIRKVVDYQNGNLDALNEMIPALRSMTSESEKMAFIQKSVASGFEQAKNEALGGVGAIDQFSNVVGDLKEDLGFMISEALLPTIKALKDFVDLLDLRKSYEIVQFVLAGIAGAVIETSKVIYNTFEGSILSISNAFVTLKDIATEVLGTISQSFGFLISGEFEQAYDTITNIGLNVGKVLQESALRQQEANQSFIDAKNAVTGYFDAMSTGYDQLQTKITETNNAIKEFPVVTKIVYDELGLLAEELNQKFIDSLTTRKMATETDLAEMNVTYQNYLDANRILDQENETLNLIGMDRRKNEEVQRYRDQLTNYQNLLRSKQISNDQYENLAEKARDIHNKKLDKIDEARSMSQTEEMQMMFSLGKNLAKEGGIAYRITASGEALIATLLNATKAGLNPILSALIMANGFANIAKINSVGFQTGGFTGYGADNEVAGMVHKNEVVIPAPVVRAMGVQNATAMASGQVGSDRGLLEEIRDGIYAVSGNVIAGAQMQVENKNTNVDFLNFTKNQNEAVLKGNYNSIGTEIF